MTGPAYQQFLQVMNCPECRSTKGETWRKVDKDGKPVVVTVDPCEAHRRMLEKGWQRA
jgi:hypothetical protein